MCEPDIALAMCEPDIVLTSILDGGQDPIYVPVSVLFFCV